MPRSSLSPAASRHGWVSSPISRCRDRRVFHDPSIQSTPSGRRHSPANSRQGGFPERPVKVFARSALLRIDPRRLGHATTHGGCPGSSPTGRALQLPAGEFREPPLAAPTRGGSPNGGSRHKRTYGVNRRSLKPRTKRSDPTQARTALEPSEAGSPIGAGACTCHWCRGRS